MKNAYILLVLLAVGCVEPTQAEKERAEAAEKEEAEKAEEEAKDKCTFVSEPGAVVSCGDGVDCTFCAVSGNTYTCHRFPLMGCP